MSDIIVYPEDCNTPGKRTEYLYRAQELLRDLHNYFSEWSHEGGKIKVQYDTIPKALKDKYPHRPELSETDLKKFMEEDFTPRSNKICQEICIQRASLKSSTAWSIDIGDI